MALAATGLVAVGRDVALATTIPTGLSFVVDGRIAGDGCGPLSAVQEGVASRASRGQGLLLVPVVSDSKGGAGRATAGPFAGKHEVLVFRFGELEELADSQEFSIDDAQVLVVAQRNEELVELVDRCCLEHPHELVKSIMGNLSNKGKTIVDHMNQGAGSHNVFSLQSTNVQFGEFGSEAANCVVSTAQ
jgi:hypothetical protein